MSAINRPTLTLAGTQHVCPGCNGSCLSEESFVTERDWVTGRIRDHQVDCIDCPDCGGTGVWVIKPMGRATAEALS